MCNQGPVKQFPVNEVDHVKTRVTGRSGIIANGQDVLSRGANFGNALISALKDRVIQLSFQPGITINAFADIPPPGMNIFRKIPGKLRYRKLAGIG